LKSPGLLRPEQLSSHGTVSLKEIWAMLDACAPGHTRKERDHNWCIRFGTKSYPSLPKGPHGRRENPAIQVGHVKNMARHLGILDCAKQRLEGLQ
jgi:hypothetical protein